MRLTSLVRPLGWFSLALGAAEMLMPRKIAAAHGVPEGKPVVRGFGAREIAAGAAVLAKPRSAVPLLARAAGDVLDIGAAGMAVRKAEGGKRKMALASLVTVAGFLALDLLVARAVSRS
jgi:hypothetical protein